jgi:hypothetical protein
VELELDGELPEAAAALLLEPDAGCTPAELGLAAHAAVVRAQKRAKRGDGA